MDFKNFIQQSAAEINLTLERYFEDQIADTNKVSEKLVHLTESFAKACKGGKRLRGALVKLGYELVAGKSNLEILVPAAAIEILQTGLLVHDDIIDLSEIRRGKPTLYKELSGDHYGISQAICLGDAAFFLSLELIANSNFPDQRKNEAIKFFINSMLKTVAGQMLDIEVPHQQYPATQKDILTVMHLKTAHYTFIGPLQLGAVLAGADKDYLDKLEVFGKNLGIAFQIQDDILGIFGDEKSLGKSATSDIEEGKVTLLYLKAREKSDSSKRAILDKLYGQGKITSKDHQQIKQVFLDTTSLDYSRQVALEYVSQAKQTIPSLTTDQQMVALLNQMADFLVERTK